MRDGFLEGEIVLYRGGVVRRGHLFRLRLSPGSRPTWWV